MLGRLVSGPEKVHIWDTPPFEGSIATMLWPLVFLAPLIVSVCRCGSVSPCLQHDRGCLPAVEGAVPVSNQGGLYTWKNVK